MSRPNFVAKLASLGVAVDNESPKSGPMFLGMRGPSDRYVD